MCVLNSKYPCGKCPECLERWRNLWSIRLQEDAKQCCNVFFGMITYDDKHIHHVVDKQTGEYFGTTLMDKELSNAIKRLRKNHGYINFAYFVTGEYSDSGRAHYHPLFLIRSFDLQNDYLLRKEPVQWRAKLKYLRRLHDQTVKMSRFMWIDTSWLFAQMMQREWSKGFVSLNPPKYGSAARCVHYATKYMLKKGVSPEHASQPHLILSKKIGLNYLTADKIKQHVGRMANDYGIGNVFYHYDRSNPISIDYYPGCRDLSTLSVLRLKKVHYEDEGQFVLEFNFKTSFYNGTYGLPRYYREHIYKLFPDYQQDFIHHVNAMNFERSYFERLKNFMEEHGFSHWSVECDRQYAEYLQNCHDLKKVKMVNKYY